jgi:hypothetical protein
MRNKNIFTFSVSILLITLISCAKSTPESQAVTFAPITITPSISDSIPEIEPYPLETNSYPMPNSGQVNQQLPKQGPDFNIDKPVKLSATMVTGNGPANVPMVLVDVSEMGQELATTTIDGQGNFIFILTSPLIVDHTIGIKLGDVQDTTLDPDDFMYSDSYYDRPLIGILFDIARVED